MASVLVIGVGSTGLSVMEQAQQFYYEFTKKNSPGPNNSAFIFLETDGGRDAVTTPNGSTDIVRCDISTQNINATLNGWHAAANGDWEKWLPNTATILNAHTGAGGQSVYGRVGLWANEQKVKSLINTLYNRIGGNRATNIYIVGSFCGGTGSGIFLDVAYMVRNCTNNGNIYGMFLLPGKQNVGVATNDRLYENSYASIKALDMFSVANTDTNKNYECTMPSGVDISNLAAPFYNVQFLTPDFSNANASVGFNELIQSAGFNLVLRLLDVTNLSAPFQDVINGRLVDYTTGVKNGIFTTVGFNMFQYPEALLEECFATSLLEDDILKRWNDTANYIDNQSVKQPIATVSAQIRVSVDSFVESAITKAVESCKGMATLGKSTFYEALKAEIATIISGNYKAPSQRHYEFGLFDSNKTGKFYTAISAQEMSIRNSLIDQIYDFVNKKSTEYQNLTIVGNILSEIVSSITRIVKDWETRYKIDGTAATWNSQWTTWIEERFRTKWSYSMFGLKTDWYKEVFEGIANLCYFNAAIPMLQLICSSMQNLNGMGAIVSNNQNPLPTLDDLNAIRSKISGLLNAQKDSITSRKNSIQGQLDNQTNPQLNFVFVGDDYKSDINVATGKYNSQASHLTFSNITQDNLWNYLNNSEEESLKADLIAQGLMFVQGLQLFGNANVVSIMKNLPQNHKLYNKVHTLLNSPSANIVSDTPAMASLIFTEQFQCHNCLKLITVSPLNASNNNGIAMQFNNGYRPSANTSDYVQLPSMKNTVVIYQEYGYLGQVNGVAKAFNPLIHISYQSQVRQMLTTKIQRGETAYDPKLRLAYLDKDALLDTSNIKIQ